VSSSPTPEATATPTCRTIEFRLVGQPAVKNRWGSGSIQPAFVVLTYLDDRRLAHLHGTWIREDGEQTDAPVDQLYRHDDDWPDWITTLTDKHSPQRPVEERVDELKADWSRYRGRVLQEAWEALRDAEDGPLTDAMHVINELLEKK
jgi:hypothetical protein